MATWVTDGFTTQERKNLFGINLCRRGIAAYRAFRIAIFSRYDHLRKEASDYQKVTSFDQTAEPWRRAIEQNFTEYVRNYYKAGQCTVYGSSQDGNITLIACIESHQFNPKNFWLVYGFHSEMEGQRSLVNVCTIIY